jgi:GNAT superfamily N-acetyltransferase
MWPTCAEISDMVVTQPYRNQGIGTAIIQSLAQVAIRMGAEELEIGAALDNPRAASLYRRLGFADSHTVMLNLETGKERVLFLRLSLREAQPAVVELD